MTNTPIEWNDKLLTGVDEIDRQHRFLVATLHDIQVRLNENPKHRLPERILRDLLAYAIYHFDTEEQLMKRHGYEFAEPALATLHVKQHRHFSSQIVDLRAQSQTGDAGTEETLLAFLTSWLYEHIAHTDQGLGEFICARTAKHDT